MKNCNKKYGLIEHIIIYHHANFELHLKFVKKELKIETSLWLWIVWVATVFVKSATCYYSQVDFSPFSSFIVAQVLDAMILKSCMIVDDYMLHYPFLCCNRNTKPTWSTGSGLCDGLAFTVVTKPITTLPPQSRDSLFIRAWDSKVRFYYCCLIC